MYSDGLVERRGETLDTGIGRLVDAVGEGRALAVDALAAHLTRSLLPAEDQRDDVALVVYRHPGPVDPLCFSATIDAAPELVRSLRSQLGQWLRESGVPRSVSTDILVASGEACSNAVEHAYGVAPPPGASVRVEATAVPERVEVRVRDRGQWRTASAAGDRGRGTGIMKGLMDEATVVTDDRGTEVVLVKRLASA